MPQMAPYNWFMMNFLFIMIILLYIIFLNFIFPFKKMLKIKKNYSHFNIKW